MYKFVLVFAFLITINLYSQSEIKMGEERYKFLMDSLLTEKSELILTKNSLNAEIDELKNRLIELDEECKSAWANHIIRKYGKKIGSVTGVKSVGDMKDTIETYLQKYNK